MNHQDPEVNHHFHRLWVNRPIIEHALLLYREARINENAPTAAVDEVRKETNEAMKFAAKLLDYPDY